MPGTQGLKVCVIGAGLICFLPGVLTVTDQRVQEWVG